LWTAAYPTGLGHRLEVARFHGDPTRPVVWEHPVYLSGETAAGIEIARPSTLTVYLDQADPRLAIENRWSRNPDRISNIFVRHKFWTSPRPAEEDPMMRTQNAPWPLVYADLMATGDARLGEVVRTWRDRRARFDQSGPPSLLQLVDKVAAELLAKSTQLSSGEVMLVGAHCRDILQGAFGHQFLLRTTSDIDLGLAISNWAAYRELVTALPSTGDTGIRFRNRADERRPHAVRANRGSSRHSDPGGSPSANQRMGPCYAGFALNRFEPGSWEPRNAEGAPRCTFEIEQIFIKWAILGSNTKLYPVYRALTF
jgi:hypothetical protein